LRRCDLFPIQADDGHVLSEADADDGLFIRWLGCAPEQVAALCYGMWVKLVPKDGADCSHRT